MSSRETYSSYFSFSLLQSFSLTHINTKLIYHQLSLNNYVPLKFSDVHFLPLHMTTRDRIRKYERKFNIIPRMNENWCIGNLREYYKVPVSFSYIVLVALFSNFLNKSNKTLREVILLFFKNVCSMFWRGSNWFIYARHITFASTACGTNKTLYFVILTNTKMHYLSKMWIDII